MFNMALSSVRIAPLISSRCGMEDAQARGLQLLPSRYDGNSDTFSRRDLLLSQAKRHSTPNDEGPGTASESNINSHSQDLGLAKLIAQKAKAAATVLNRYRIGYKNDWDLPKSILHSQVQIQTALERDIPINLVIPAFPFKSSNRSKKVLGPLPDEAERLSLLHLDGLCNAITDVTGSETFLIIVSDGITYNGINSLLDSAKELLTRS